MRSGKIENANPPTPEQTKLRSSIAEKTGKNEAEVGEALVGWEVEITEVKSEKCKGSTCRYFYRYEI
jgi:hypothetical protein